MSTTQSHESQYPTDIERVLTAQTALWHLEGPDLDAFARAVDVIRLGPGEILFRQGEPGDSIYYVVSGRLEVFVQRPEGGQQLLAHLAPGEFTGANKLLTGWPRSATVRATENVELIRIKRATLDSLAEKYPHVRTEILEAASRRLPMVHLASMDLFKDLDAALLAEFNHASNWLRVPGGAVVFQQGDPGDGLYVVADGRLQVIVEHDGRREVVAHVRRGDCVGEMALLTGERRSATVVALRDSELIRLSAEDCQSIFERHPRALMGIARMLVHRLRDTTAGRRPHAEVSTIAVVPTSDDPVHAQVARELVAALARQGFSVLHLNRRTLEERLGRGTADTRPDHFLSYRILNWLNEQEGRYRYLVYECDITPSAWTARCLRQADLLLFVAAAGTAATPGLLEAKLHAGEMGHCETPRELVLVHSDTSAPHDTHEWLGPGRFARHHHVCRERRADYERLARMVTGRALSLVLGGGGARGFAHIGALRAFDEACVPIDIIGGTSMGAVVGAQYAAGYRGEALIELNRRSFVTSRPLRDFTLPLVSLITGGRMVKVLGQMFGEARIEDQWLSYFCVASNLSQADITVHQQGPLWRAVTSSIAVPGIAPPLVHLGDFLVDGGVLDNLPIGVMRRLASGTVFAVDVSGRVEFKTTRAPYARLSGWQVLRDRLNPFAHHDAVPSILRILTRAAMLNSVNRSAEIRRAADVYIHPPIEGIEMFDWKALDQAVEIGYRATAGALNRWAQSRTAATA